MLYPVLPIKAEIKRLQEANKAARKERHLILKQQEEIERIRQTTMKLQEKLKFAGENKVISYKAIILLILFIQLTLSNETAFHSKNKICDILKLQRISELYFS